jgi:hypothetical protein
MKRLWFWIWACLLFLGSFGAVPVSAADVNYVTPVFPVRSPQYWRQGSDPRHFSRVYDLVKQTGLPSTWLLHYDVFNNPDSTGLTAVLKAMPRAEIGLFLEVTRDLADASFVRYAWNSDTWSSAYRVFLSGYTPAERRRLIDTAFTAFKAEFGYYPAAYGAWYIDVSSLEYIREKYGSRVVLGLADQYSTDGYQTWGQYLNVPYFVSKTSAIEPADSLADSTGVLKLQWAPREPTLGIGADVQASNFSAQVNDYHRQKGLGTDYFRTLLADLTVNSPGAVSQAVIGIEVGELEPAYLPALQSQLQVLAKEAAAGQIKAVTMSEFLAAYTGRYPAVSPAGIIGSSAAAEPVWWYFDHRLRLGIKLTASGASLVDLRFYHRSGYRDNDQVSRDTRENLVRLVPAEIDQVTLRNPVALTAGPVKVSVQTDLLRLTSPAGELVVSPGGVFTTFPGVDARLFTPPQSVAVDRSGCRSEFGGYAGKFSCLKQLVSRLFAGLPDPVYSRLEGQVYLGFRTGFTQVWGLRLPQLRLGNFTFPFPVLDNFISLKRKLTPEFVWTGKQEIELGQFAASGQILPKGTAYGQEELLNLPNQRKMFENGYYLVLSAD